MFDDQLYPSATWKRLVGQVLRRQIVARHTEHQRQTCCPTSCTCDKKMGKNTEHKTLKTPEQTESVCIFSKEFSKIYKSAWRTFQTHPSNKTRPILNHFLLTWIKLLLSNKSSMHLPHLSALLNVCHCPKIFSFVCNSSSFSILGFSLRVRMLAQHIQIQQKQQKMTKMWVELWITTVDMGEYWND